MIANYLRSYMRRSGRMTSAQRLAYAQYQSTWCREPAEIVGPYFGFDRVAPLVLEIGFGMGEQVVAMASREPHHHFLAVDVYRPGIAALLLQCAKRALTNVRVMECDVHVLIAALPAQCLARVTIFFPDPWPKKRHQKRRLVQADLVRDLARVVKVGGVVCLATDDDVYAEHMRTVFDNPYFHRDASFNQQDVRSTTKYEARGKRLGHQIHELNYQRTSALVVAQSSVDAK